jgi:HEAT repeat protein
MRAAAFHLLADLPDQARTVMQVRQAVLKSARREEHKRVLVNVALCLGLLGDPEAIDELLNLANQDSDLLSTYALKMLATGFEHVAPQGLLQRTNELNLPLQEHGVDAALEGWASWWKANRAGLKYSPTVRRWRRS